MSCCLSLALRLFVLFRFRIFAFIEDAALRSIVFRYACASTAPRSNLTVVCVLFYFSFVFVSLEMPIFPSTLYGTFNMPTSYQEWVWEREAHINWSMVTCQGSTRSELP